MQEERVATQNGDTPLRESVLRPATSTETSGRRSRARSKRAKTRQVAALQISLFATVAVAFLAGLAGLVYIKQLSNENDKLFFESRKQEKEITEAKQLIGELMTERDSLVEGRIPGLKEIAYDQSFEVDTAYVRNIIFTLTRTNGNNTYEYKLVVENQTLDEIRPRVYVRFFDQLGTQVGGADIGVPRTGDAYQTNALDHNHDLLKPDEIRSYSDNLEVVAGAVPRYFTVVVQ